MNIPEFLDLLKAQLSKLSNDDVAAFAISICNRLLPYYLEFHEHSTWGNPNTLLDSIKFCETTNCFDSTKKSTLLRLASQIESIIPVTEEFENGSLALNASASVLELVAFILDKDLDHTLNISNYMIDTVDFISREEDLAESVVNKKISQEMKYQLELTRRC